MRSDYCALDYLFFLCAEGECFFLYSILILPFLFLFCARIYVQATPLLGIMGIAIAGVTAYCIYAMVTKNDVM